MRWDLYTRLGHLIRVDSFDRACELCYMLRDAGMTVWMVHVKE